eukprot:scaffold79255_cov19-Tisochrysis_lutea.AAC.3
MEMATITLEDLTLKVSAARIMLTRHTAVGSQGISLEIILSLPGLVSPENFYAAVFIKTQLA